MAERLTVQLIDDLDGSDAEETIHLAINGSAWRLDLSKANAKAFWEAQKPYMEAGQPAAEPARRGPSAAATSGARRRASSGAAAAGVDPKAVRVWADENNLAVPSRGRIPKPILDQYLAANGG